MSFFKEFKEFAVRGNVVDMAVGIIIGAAFGKIVTSFVEDIIMPLLGMLTGGVDFSDRKLLLQAATETDPAVTLNYGMMLQVTLNFVIVAFAIFLLVKVINKLKRQEEKAEAPVPAPSKEEVLLGEIRDLLKENAKR